jgi:hypothetical protein
VHLFPARERTVTSCNERRNEQQSRNGEILLHEERAATQRQKERIQLLLLQRERATGIIEKNDHMPNNMGKSGKSNLLRKEQSSTCIFLLAFLPN